MIAFDACWEADDARNILVTEALEGDDAVFLATHSPITGFDVDGRDGVDIKGRDEQAVLDALSPPERQHAFCVVQGEPGSGKSHLIRWLSVNWPGGNDVKLLLRRADGSLEGALRQLKERLPAEFSNLFDNLGQKHRAGTEGRANIFLSTLGDTLAPNHFDPKLGDEAYCIEHAPGEVVGHPAVKRRWKGPARILKLMEGAEGHRNSSTASFDLFDIETLANACRTDVIGGGITARAEELVRRLDREAEVIKAYREQDWNAEDLALEVPEKLRTSLGLIKVLNNRRNDAIQNVLGVSAAGLQTLFRSVRQRLQARGQRLVLLLEDITSWEGLDDSLIEVLIFNAGAKDDEQTDDVCPLISVVGVTPTYYEKLHPNRRQRITHEIRLGESKGGLQDVASLRDPLARRRFFSRYLAAVRAGLPALRAWRETLRGAPETPPPNVCEGCPHQIPCSQVFGDDEGVGLFPFTDHAIERFFDALKENDNRQTWRTPRGVLQAVLNHNLSQPETLAEGRFPPPLIEPTAFREDRKSDRVLSNRLGLMVTNRVAAPDEQARLRRMLAYWAFPERADTTLNGEELAFAGASQSLFAAFSLPWIGGDSATTTTSVALPPPPSEPTSLLPPTEEEPLLITPEISPVPTSGLRYGQRTARPTVIAPKPKHAGPKRSELETFRDELRTWKTTGSIESASNWNRMLHEMLRALDPRRFGVSPALYMRIVTPERVKLQGTTSGGRDNLVVGPESWVVDGFEAYLALRLGGLSSQDDAAFHREKLAAMMRRLEGMARDYVERRIPRLDSGDAWSPVVALGQVLLARAWLRGGVSPTAPLHRQLSEILSDEDLEPTSDPRARSAPWQAWLNATDKSHKDLREELRGMVSLSINDAAGGAGLTDVSELAAGLKRLVDTGQIDEAPSTDGGLPDELRKARELAVQWRDKAALIDRTEIAQLRNRCETLNVLLRDHAVRGTATPRSGWWWETCLQPTSWWRRVLSQLKRWRSTASSWRIGLTT
jgi:hypothetical protein